MLSARLVLAVLVTAIASLAIVAQASATFPGANGILAWTGEGAIYGVDPGSTSERLIVDVPGGDDESPSWSADGQQLVFEHDDDPVTPNQQASIWKANADGTGATPVTSGPRDYQPSWSPDGQKIVFASGPGGPNQRDLFVVDADGTNRTQLTFTAQSSEAQPTWSPDGTKIAYQAFVSGGGEQIWTMNPDGTNQAFLINGRAPEWSPYGDELVIGRGFPGDTSRLARVALDGTQTPLTNQGGNAAFSPDGTRIAYRGAGVGEATDIFTTGYNGGPAQSVAPPGDRQNPGWQPIPQPPAPVGFVRPKGASPLRVSLVPAFRACTEPNREHGPPLAYGSCAPPTQESTTATLGTSSTGSVRLKTVVGNPGTAADEADVIVNVTLTDVRRMSNLEDYALALGVPLRLRITDRGGGHSATVTDSGESTPFLHTWPLRITVPCTTTADPDIGSDCSVSTTVDAVVPGAVDEGERAVWDTERIRVFDGGVEEDPTTPVDDELLAVQGVFVP